MNRIPLYRMQQGRSFRFSSHSDTVCDAEIIPGNTESEIVTISGCGVIHNFWFTLSSPDPHYMKNVLLKAYWDDEETPSIFVPFGDFFCNGYDKRVPFVSNLIGVTSGGFYSYFEMPFQKNARFRVVNETEQDLIVYYNFNGYYLERLDNTQENPLLYFHANWTRQNPTREGEYYPVLRAKGKGYFAGISLNMAAFETQSKFNFLEGDELIYIDGEKEASIKGTGTEDYFQGGWYFIDGTFHAPYHGMVLHDWGKSRISCYRFHTVDRIAFQKELVFNFEHGQRLQNQAKADYFSVAYWYQTEPHSKRSFPDMPKPEGRQIIEPEPIYRISGAIEAETMQKAEGYQAPGEPWLKDTVCYMCTYINGWSDHIARRFELLKDGFVELIFTVNESGNYDIGFNFIGYDACGIASCSIDGRFVGDVDCYLDEPKDFELLCKNKALGTRILTNMFLEAGDHCVRLVSSKKNERSKGYELTLDCIVLI